MAKSLVMFLGVVLLLVGVLGFFNDPILGIFETDAIHNIVHILTGVVALAMASMGEASAKTFGKVFGIVYLLVTVLGYVAVSDGKILGLISINGADNILHIALTLVFLYVGFSKSSSSPAPMGGAPMGGQM